ncbi:hypothetical protein Tco_0285796 [Tanacetum coccineum]
MLLATKDEVGVILFNEHNDFILTDGAQMEEFEELSANIYMMAIIQQQCDIIFDDPNVEINDGKVEHDKNAHDHHDNELELLAKNAYKEAGKQLILAKKHKFNTIEDKYLDDILKLEAKVKKNENVVVKMSNSIQAMFMLGPKALSVYDPQLKHGTSTSNVTPANASKSSSPPLTMPKSSKIIKYFHTLENEINKLYTLLKSKTATKSILYIIREDTLISHFWYDEVKTILDYLHTIFKDIQKEFPEDVRDMMNVSDSMESDLDETLKQN